jgi:cytochrome c-type biogenesis protein CcmH/NrfG
MPKPEVVEAPPTEVSPSVAPEPPSPVNTKPPPAASSADYERTIQRAKSAFASRRYQVAATNYRMALKLFPDSQEAKEGLGFSLVLGNLDDESFEEAVKLLRDVVNQNSLNAGAWFALGMALQGTQEEDEAIEAYKQYLVLEPAGRFSSDARRALKRLGAN